MSGHADATSEKKRSDLSSFYSSDSSLSVVLAHSTPFLSRVNSSCWPSSLPAIKVKTMLDDCGTVSNADAALFLSADVNRYAD